MTTMICSKCGCEKPIDEFAGNRYGVTNVCKECVSKAKVASRRKKIIENAEKVAAEVANARNLKLADFAPVELMKELKRRGYKGTLTFTEIRTINLDTL